jgi:hypothetical protein
MSKNPYQHIIQAILNSCRGIFTENDFHLDPAAINSFVVSGNDMSSAFNHYKNNSSDVKVLRWFDDFWIFMNIWFVLRKNQFPQTFLTISIFQGEEDDSRKNQLFRAEWDNHENNVFHPQPHWQIYPNKYHHRVYDDFEAFNDMKNEGYEAKMEVESDKLIDLRKIHFAMNAEWSKKQGAIHTLSDIDVLTNWIQGLFIDIKYQLKHAQS